MTKQEKSEKLSKFLADRGLTQKRIADKLGVSEPCVTLQIKRGVPMLTCLFSLFVHRANINPNLAFWSIFVTEEKLVCGFDNLLVREHLACVMMEHIECHISVARGGACWKYKVFGRLLDLGFRPILPVTLMSVPVEPL